MPTSYTVKTYSPLALVSSISKAVVKGTPGAYIDVQYVFRSESPGRKATGVGNSAVGPLISLVDANPGGGQHSSAGDTAVAIASTQGGLSAGDVSLQIASPVLSQTDSYFWLRFRDTVGVEALYAAELSIHVDFTETSQ